MLIVLMDRLLVNSTTRTSIWACLVVQWLRIRLEKEERRVWSLVWQDPTCHGAAGRMCHDYWAVLWRWEPRPESMSHDRGARAPFSLCSTAREDTTVKSPHTTTRESPCAAQRPSTAENERQIQKVAFKKKPGLNVRPGRLWSFHVMLCLI